MEEDTVLKCLKQYFKFDKFKTDLQREAVLEVCQRKHDVLISMPTGSGKSLCYQLPAMMYPDMITIIFSPLLALIKDQIDHLVKLKIRASTINSKITNTEREAIMADLKSTSPNTRILYVTPEQAATQTFKALYQNLFNFNKIAYLVVDEAHCVSEWGHDFRPQYRKLADLRLGVDVPCIALTATANTEVTKDIIENLKLGKDFGRDLRIYKSSCFRRNLFYDVYYPNILEDPYKHLKNFVSGCLKDEEDLPMHQKSCGIIYCRTREQTELLMERLNKLGIKTLCYHAGLKPHERKMFQDKWQSGEVPVICATISFGMGVDKATVRFVIHWGSPKDPASYYQESGRAGRDGKPAYCRVYYNRADSKAIDYHLTQDLGKAGSNELKRKRMERAIKDFKKILVYCENPSECRHRIFSDYFGEPPPKCVNRCDYCKDKKKVVDLSELFLTKSIQFNTMAVSSSNIDFTDLYGGGRQGMKEADENTDSGDERHAVFEREQEAKKASNDFIQKQFALRRNPHEMSQQTVDMLFSKHARVKAAASSSNKVKGLTLATREQYVSKLLDMFHVNYTDCQEEPEFDRKDIEDCAIDVEYEIFSSTTNMTMYRNAIVKLLVEIKKCTETQIVHEKLLLFEPKAAKHKTLSDLFRNITKEQQLKKLNGQISNENVGFVSAGQILDKNKQNGKSVQSKIGNFLKKKPEKSTQNKEHLKTLFGDDCDNVSDGELIASESSELSNTDDESSDVSDDSNKKSKYKKKSKEKKRKDKKKSKKKKSKDEKKRKRIESNEKTKSKDKCKDSSEKGKKKHKSAKQNRSNEKSNRLASSQLNINKDKVGAKERIEHKNKNSNNKKNIRIMSRSRSRDRLKRNKRSISRSRSASRGRRIQRSRSRSTSRGRRIRRSRSRSISRGRRIQRNRSRSMSKGRRIQRSRSISTSRGKRIQRSRSRDSIRLSDSNRVRYYKDNRSRSRGQSRDRYRNRSNSRDRYRNRSNSKDRFPRNSVNSRYRSRSRSREKYFRYRGSKENKKDSSVETYSKNRETSRDRRSRSRERLTRSRRESEDRLKSFRNRSRSRDSINRQRIKRRSSSRNRNLNIIKFSKSKERSSLNRSRSRESDKSLEDKDQHRRNDSENKKFERKINTTNSDLENDRYMKPDMKNDDMRRSSNESSIYRNRSHSETEVEKNRSHSRSPNDRESPTLKKDESSDNENRYKSRENSLELRDFTKSSPEDNAISTKSCSPFSNRSGGKSNSDMDVSKSRDSSVEKEDLMEKPEDLKASFYGGVGNSLEINLKADEIIKEYREFYSATDDEQENENQTTEINITHETIDVSCDNIAFSEPYNEDLMETDPTETIYKDENILYKPLECSVMEKLTRLFSTEEDEDDLIKQTSDTESNGSAEQKRKRSISSEREDMREDIENVKRLKEDRDRIEAELELMHQEQTLNDNLNSKDNDILKSWLTHDDDDDEDDKDLDKSTSSADTCTTSYAQDKAATKTVPLKAKIFKQSSKPKHLHNGSVKPKPRVLKKTEIGTLVVKILTPAYVERRFESRQVFKNLARTISHALADKTEDEITKYVTVFLEKNDKITSTTEFQKSGLWL